MIPSSHSGFQIGEIGICYTESKSTVATIFCLLSALVVMVALFGMMAGFSWQPFRLALLWPAMAALAFAAFATLLFVLAIAPPQVLTFDATQRKVRGRARRHLGLPRNLELDFMALQSLKLQPFTQESGDTFYQIHIGIAGQPPILLGAFSEFQEAQYWSDRLAELIAQELPGTE